MIQRWFSRQFVRKSKATKKNAEAEPAKRPIKEEKKSHFIK
jgi:hypothetical protein